MLFHDVLKHVTDLFSGQHTRALHVMVCADPIGSNCLWLFLPLFLIDAAITLRVPRNDKRLTGCWQKAVGFLLCLQAHKSQVIADPA